MFFLSQNHEQQERYKDLLKVTGSISRMYSDNVVPYLYYRAAENIFCKAFDAENLSRGDVSADASKNDLGIGLKTFLHSNGNTLQKIAEFNKGATDYQTLDPRDIVESISKMRNERIEFTKRAHGLNQMIYHLVTRQKERFNIFEEDMDLIDLSSIRITKTDNNNIYFNDKFHEYKFDRSKSTLSKRFTTKKPIVYFDVKIMDDPYNFLLNSIPKTTSLVAAEEMADYSTLNDYIYLPLYSTRTKEVHRASGLNQWNAKGRTRHPDELYIPIPIWIHRRFSGFFPFDLKSGKEGEPFKLELPDKTVIDAKICQANGKALMSNPNRALGNWLLRKVLRIKPGQKVKYQDLENIGIDSVIISKVSDSYFRIDFTGLGSFEKFEEENK